jgi:hypothetical protein
MDDPPLPHATIDHQQHPYSTATNKGHVRHHRVGIQSTRTMQPAIIQAQRNGDSLQLDKEICATHDMFSFATLANLNTGTMHTNLPGTFPVSSAKSMQCIFLVYIYNLNTILVHAITSKNNAAMFTLFTKILATLAAHGYKPTLNVMDSECSNKVEAYIKSNKMDIHLSLLTTTVSMLPNMPLPHSRIAGLATVNRNCPVQLWDKFLHQVELTCNLLHFSCHDPSKFANEEVHGPYDFNQTPIAPTGTKSLVTLPTVPAGHCTMELMHSTLALPLSTIGVYNSTCQPSKDVALQTLGIFTQAIA